MKPSGRSSYAGLLPAGRKKVECFYSLFPKNEMRFRGNVILMKKTNLLRPSMIFRKSGTSTAHRGFFFLFFAYI